VVGFLVLVGIIVGWDIDMGVGPVGDFQWLSLVCSLMLPMDTTMAVWFLGKVLVGFPCGGVKRWEDHQICMCHMAEINTGTSIMHI